MMAAEKHESKHLEQEILRDIRFGIRVQVPLFVEDGKIVYVIRKLDP
jgi:hypothetical protein